MFSNNNSGIVVMKNDTGVEKIKVEYSNNNFDPGRYFGGTTSSENLNSNTASTDAYSKNSNYATLASDILRNISNKKGNR